MILFLIVVAAAMYLLLLAPVRTYLGERHQMAQQQHRYQVLSNANKQLQARADQLKSDSEIENLAREQYDLVPPGQEAFAVMPPPPSASAPAAASKHKEGFWAHAWDDITFWN